MGRGALRCYPIRVKPGAKDLVCIGLLLLLVAAAFPPPAFTPSNLLATRFSDAVTQYLPHQVFVRRSLLVHRRLPFWNPYECAGTPAFPNPLYPAFSFPSLLLSPLPPALALNLGFLLHFFLAGALSFACARQAGCSRAGALLAGIVVSLGARSLTHAQAGLYSRLAIFSFIPLLFFCAERCLRAPSAASAACLAVSLSLACLTGEAQILACALAGIAAYAALRPRATPVTAAPRQARRCLLLGVLLSAPLSAFYLLPAHRLYPLLSRSHPLGQARFDFAPSLGEIAASLVSPSLVGEYAPLGTLSWECALFAGVAPLLLLLRNAPSRMTRRDVALWGLLAAGAVLLSARELSFVHAALDRLVPFFGRFRNPGRLLYLVPFFLAMLAARLFDAVAGAMEPRRGGAGRAWFAVCAAGMLLYGTLWAAMRGADPARLAANLSNRFVFLFGEARLPLLDAARAARGASRHLADAVGSLRFSLLLVPVLCLLCALRERARIRRGVFSFAFCALAFLELLRSSGAFLAAQPLGLLHPASPLAAAIGKAGNDCGRMLDMTPPRGAAFWAAYPFASSTALDISRVDGYTPVNFSAYARFLDLASGAAGPLPRWSLAVHSIEAPELLSLLGVGLVLSDRPPGIPGLRPDGVFAGVPVYRQFLGEGVAPRLLLFRNPERLPHAWLVARATVCPPGEEGRTLRSFDPRLEALLAPGARPLAAEGGFRAVSVRRAAPGLLEAEVATEQPAHLCTREIWAPGWEAALNGTPVEVTRTNGIFCGIRLPPGRHAVRLRYTPPGFRIGAVVSLFTLAGLVITMCVRSGKTIPYPPDSPGHT